MREPRLLERLKVLVVEDNFLLAEVTKDLLEQNGWQVVGPVGWLASGVKIAQDEELDGAILDINLHGEFSFPIAEVLRAHGVPFMYVTGYNDVAIIPAALRTVKRLDKPVADGDLLEAAATLFRARAV